MSISTSRISNRNGKDQSGFRYKLKPVFNAGKSIEINNVTVSFKTPKGIYTAVKDISLSVKKGEIISTDRSFRLR